MENVEVVVNKWEAVKTASVEDRAFAVVWVDKGGIDVLVSIVCGVVIYEKLCVDV